MLSLKGLILSFFLCVSVLLPLSVLSQGKGFKYRAGDRQGNTRYIITATNAVPKANGVMALSQARLEVYSAGKVETVVTVDDCEYDRNGNKLDATGRVSIKREGVTITGDGLQWDDTTRTVIIRKDAKVQIKNGAMARKRKPAAAP